MGSCLERSRRVFKNFNYVVWVCGNKNCTHYGDDTPTADEYSKNCLMCNKPHVPLSSIEGN